MKKLVSTSRQRKKQATTTNLVHVKQVESRNTGGGVFRRTVQNQTRSCESTVQSSDSVQEEEETTAASNLSSELIKSPESTDTGMPPRSSREPSDSSLTLSLPKEIRTSWLENERSSKSEMDAAASAALARLSPPPSVLQLQRTHTSEARSTAKSIFSTNKSVVMETQRNSISMLPGGHAPPSCRPPDYPPEVSTETSEYSDVHQYQSVDGSFNSHSDKEFRSLSSKAGAPQGSDMSLVGMPATGAGARAGSESSVGTKPFVVSSRVDVDSAASRGTVAGLPRTGEEDAFRNGWFSRVQQGFVMPSASASLDTTASRGGAIDLPSATSLESHKYWSADALPAVSSCTSAATGLESDFESGAIARDDYQRRLSGVPSADTGPLHGHDGRPVLRSSSFKSAVSSAASERDAASSLQNIPGKMADLFKAFATPAIEGYEATTTSSATLPMPKELTCTSTRTIERKPEQFRSSRDISTTTRKEAHPEHPVGLSTSAVLGSTGVTASASALRGGLPARRFSLQERSDAASNDKPALSGTPSAIASHEQQRTATGSAETCVTAPKPSIQRPPKEQAASQPQVGTKPHRLPSARHLKKGTESRTTTLSLKSKSQTEALPGIAASAESAIAAASFVEQPPKSFIGALVPSDISSKDQQLRELTATSRGPGGAFPLTAEHGKRTKTGSPATASGLASPKMGKGEHRKVPSAGKVSEGAVSPKGEQRKKHSPHSPTTSGVAPPKVSAEGRAEHPPARRTASGTSSPNVPAGIQQQMSPGVLDWRGTATSVQPSLAPIDERLERSTTSFSISEVAAPKPPAHALPSAVDRHGSATWAITATTGAKVEVAAVAAITEETPSAEVQAHYLSDNATVPGVGQTSTFPDGIRIEAAKIEGSADRSTDHLASTKEQLTSLAADTNLAAELPTTLIRQPTEEPPDGELTELEPGVVAEHQITRTVMRSFTVIPLTEKGPDKEKETGVSLTVSSDALITQKAGGIGAESSEIDVAVLSEDHREKPPQTTGEPKGAGFVGAVRQLVEQPYEVTAQEDSFLVVGSELTQPKRPKELQKTEKTGLREISRSLEQVKESPPLVQLERLKKEGSELDHEGLQKIEVLGKPQERLDPTQTTEPKVPSGEFVEALFVAPVDASNEGSRTSIEQTIDSSRRGVTDDQSKRAEHLGPAPGKTVTALQEPFGEERVRLSASSPVSIEGREPGFLFEESLRRPTVSSSWAEASTQDEERRRSSSVGSPRAALTVSAAPSDDLHLAIDRGDKVQAEQRRRMSTPSTARPSTITNGTHPDETSLTAASDGREYSGSTSKESQKGPKYRSDPLSTDSSTAASCMRPKLDYHGDVSRKSQEVMGEAGVTHEDHTSALPAGVFVDKQDQRVAGPAPEDTASERAVTVSDSRGFQPSLVEGLFQQLRQSMTGSRKSAEVAAGKKDEERSAFVETVVTKPRAELDIEGTASGTPDDIGEDAEKTRDLYPFFAPEEDLGMAVSAMNLTSEPIDFEASFGGRSTLRDDRSSTTFLPVSSGEVRQGHGLGQRGGAAARESLREGSAEYDREDGACVALSDSDIGRPPIVEIVFTGSPPQVRGIPCTALVEIPSEQRISVAPTRELLEQNFWETEGGLSACGTYISLEDTEPPFRSSVMQAAARLFRVASPLPGTFPAQEEIPPNAPVLTRADPPPAPPQSVAEQWKEPQEKASKEREMPGRIVNTMRSTLDSVAPVVALSFALFAFVTAAALLLSRDGDEVHHL
ncbi:mucin-22-like [Dermacentor albipictus]|uniref:mucin-22-like n=1 Tax=Dermacentor albipictus TaxID=60249 RepID=UPI0038FCABAD